MQEASIRNPWPGKSFIQSALHWAAKGASTEWGIQTKRHVCTSSLQETNLREIKRF
jgi:hypothetical protein